jgi:hypothetical protein
MNCVDVCPKGLNPTKAIGKIKELTDGAPRRLTAMLEPAVLNKLKWRCRRGLLENDLFIERFFRRHEETLTNRRRKGSTF